MEYFEKLRNLSGSALDTLARALYERDVKVFEEIIVGLTRLGTMQNYETAAAMLATVPMRAHSGKTNYTDARFGALVFDQYFNMYLQACADMGMGENEYMAVLLSAQYGKKGGAFNNWDKSVDRYLTALAKADFDRAADYVEKFDKKFGKYSTLISVDRDRALNRLLHLALYVKNIDKAAVRDVLMDYSEVIDCLIALYASSAAHERVAIVRLLLTYKNDERVRAFLNDTVANDKSKTVRDAAFPNRTEQNKNAALHIENMMINGKGLTYSEWKSLLKNASYGDVADKVFFYTVRSGERISVLVYNDGKFLNSDDREIDISADQKIFVLHPLDVDGEAAGLLSLKITQPFLQINRPTFGRISGEGYYSSRLAGTMIARDEFLSNMKASGFSFCDKRADDETTVAVKTIGEYAIGVECDLPESSYTAGCGRLLFYRASDIVRLKRKKYISTANALDIRSLPLKAYSELVYSAYKLFGSENG